MLGPLLVDLSRDLGVSLGQAGLLATFTAVPQALGSPFAGVLADRLGRRPMIILALTSMGTLALTASAAPSFAVLVVIRFTAGLVGSLGPTSLAAALGDLCRAERLARAMTSFNLGFSLAALGIKLGAQLTTGVLGFLLFGAGAGSAGRRHSGHAAGADQLGQPSGLPGLRLGAGSRATRRPRRRPHPSAAATATRRIAT